MESALYRTTFSPIFLEPLILRARSARKIKGSRKIGDGIDRNGMFFVKRPATRAF